jgi:citrate lyase subunit beta/citryl-CoA lyase
MVERPTPPTPRLRSLLFAPANRPDVLAKLPRSGPDGVVIDLEDAVPAGGKPDARVHARRVGAALAADHPGIAVYVRVNAVPSEWFADDVDDGLVGALHGVVVPKLESPEQVDAVAAALGKQSLEHLAVVAGVETAMGVAHADEVASHPAVAAVYFGAEDYVADLGGIRTETNLEVLYARSRVALAARIAGVHALDQVVTALDDAERFLRDAAEGRALGYRGKLCIHPAQVPLANQAFSASHAELDRARRLVAAYDAATARGVAAIAFEGQMVDEPLARQARAVLASADDRV